MAIQTIHRKFFISHLAWSSAKLVSQTRWSDPSKTLLMVPGPEAAFLPQDYWNTAFLLILLCSIFSHLWKHVFLRWEMGICYYSSPSPQTVRQLIWLSFIHFLPLIRILKHDKYLKNTWVYFWTLYVTSNKYSVALFLTVELIKCLISVLSNTISVYHGKNIAQSLSSKTL